MVRRTSKGVKEVVDKIRLTTVVRLSGSFLDHVRNVTDTENILFVTHDEESPIDDRVVLYHHIH